MGLGIADIPGSFVLSTYNGGSPKIFPLTRPNQFEISIDNKTFVIDLEPNLNLISKYAQIQYLSDPNVVRKTKLISDQEEKFCFYHGKVENYSDSSIALSICDGLVSNKNIKNIYKTN